MPAIALLAHVDTAPHFTGTGVKPIVHRDYNGDPIVLPDDPNLITRRGGIRTWRRTGDDIVTASGNTLLGADDKAGVTILMTAAATC